MHENKDIFTITLIVDGDNSKLLISTSETPAKEDSEAAGVIYKEDLPSQFNEIISKIPLFKTAMEEDGSEESITHSVDEFLHAYELDLLDLIEQGEEILHTDLDNDNEDDEKDEELEDHREEVLGLDNETKSDPFDIYRRDDDLGKEDALSHIDPRAAFENY